jgi:opacity protein-like surface antigen
MNLKSKNIIKFSSILFSVGSVHGAGFNGLYVGGNLGTDYTPVINKLDDGERNLANSIVTDKNRGSHLNGNVGLFLGYNVPYTQSIFVGAEGFVDTYFSSNNQLSKSHDRYTTAIKKKGIGFGLLARAGLLVSDKTALYIGLGGKSTPWHVKTASKWSDSVTNSKKARKYNFLFQTGVEGIFGCNNHFAWRVSYSLIPSDKICQRRLKGKMFNMSPSDIKRNYSTFKMTQHQVAAGISYRFNQH